MTCRQQGLFTEPAKGTVSNGELLPGVVLLFYSIKYLI